MEGKQQDKQWKIGKKTVLVLAGAIIAVAAITVVAIALSGGQTESEKLTLKIQTPYIDLQLPLELEEIITNDESTYGEIYTCGFYMNYGGEEVPLWRVDFGDAKSADWIGRLVTDAGDVPVAMTGFAITDAELAALGEEGSLLYGECMQAYSVMLEGIMADSRFTTERALAIGEDTNVKLQHWTVTLPNKITVQESSNSGIYEAVFTGEIVGEAVQLYRIRIGGEQIGSQLGYFTIDGVKKPLYIESFALEERDSWTLDDYETAYRMMDTINDVIKAITSSKNYSEFSEE